MCKENSPGAGRNRQDRTLRTLRVSHEDNPPVESDLYAVAGVGSRTLSPVERLPVVAIGHGLSTQMTHRVSILRAGARLTSFGAKVIWRCGVFLGRRSKMPTSYCDLSRWLLPRTGCRSARAGTVSETKIVFVVLAQELLKIDNSIIDIPAYSRAGARCRRWSTCRLTVKNS